MTSLQKQIVQLNPFDDEEALVLGVKRIATNGRNKVFEVSGSGHKPRILKIDVENSRSRPHKLQIEQWAALKARAAGVLAPAYLKTGITSCGTAYSLTERLSGHSLTSSQIRTQIIRDLGLQLQMLSKIKLAGFGWLNPVSWQGTYSHWNSFLTDFFLEAHQKLSAMGAFTSGELEGIQQVVETKSPSLHVEKSSLVHRDLRPANILAESNRIVAILDWENAIAGDPLMDIAIFSLAWGCSKHTRHLLEAQGHTWNLQLQEKIGLYRIICGVAELAFRVKTGMRSQTLRSLILKDIQSIG